MAQETLINALKEEIELWRKANTLLLDEKRDMVKLNDELLSENNKLHTEIQFLKKQVEELNNGSNKSKRKSNSKKSD